MALMLWRLFLTAFLIFQILPDFEQIRCQILTEHDRAEYLRQIY